jgi:hypothetical protein
MQKRWKLGLVIAVPSVLALGLVAWGGVTVMQRTGEAGAAQAALGAFLAMIREGRIDGAYRAAAPELRCRMTFEQFRGLGNYYSKLQPALHAYVSLRHGWPYSHIADIEVATHFDQDIPHHAALLKLDEGWRVAWIDRDPVADVQARDKRCGERSMHIAMIRGPAREIVDGLERGDYSALAARFHPSSGITAEKLAAAYAPLKPRAAALREALLGEPQFDANSICAESRCKLAGNLAATAQRFAFRAELVLDGGWKLMRFEVDAASTPN